MENTFSPKNSPKKSPEKEVKKRGRKKKIITEENKDNILEKNNSTKETKETKETKNIEICENNSQKSLETLQIEQVKKKRGRKKKWEVETTTKLIQNEPISFSEKINKEEESSDINENYQAQNILFGNLNIKVHTNKDVVQVTDIKESLRKKKENSNACKIDISNSDLEDSDNEDINNEYLNNDISNNNNFNINKSKENNISKAKLTKYKNNYKLHTKKIERNINVMKYYTNEFDLGNEIITSKCRCYNCHHNFNNKPYFLPIDYNPELQRFKVTGNFCSPNCVKSYALNSRIYSSKCYLIGHMYRKLFGATYQIKPAPPLHSLKEYGGTLTIDEFRANFNNNIKFSLKDICSKIVTDEIICH